MSVRKDSETNEGEQAEDSEHLPVDSKEVKDKRQECKNAREKEQFRKAEDLESKRGSRTSFGSETSTYSESSDESTDTSSNKSSMDLESLASDANSCVVAVELGRGENGSVKGESIEMTKRHDSTVGSQGITVNAMVRNSKSCSSDTDSVFVDIRKLFVTPSTGTLYTEDGHIETTREFESCSENSTQASRQETPEDIEGDSCRICHCGVETEVLISPCLCMGTVRYVHHSCFMDWLQRCVKTKCELCLYPVAVQRKTKPLKKWRPPDEKPTPIIWLLTFVIALTLNVASIAKDGSQRCISNPCIIFYVVGALGAMLGFAFFYHWLKKSIRYIQRWVALNEEWSLIGTTNLRNLGNANLAVSNKSLERSPSRQARARRDVCVLESYETETSDEKPGTKDEAADTGTKEQTGRDGRENAHTDIAVLDITSNTTLHSKEDIAEEESAIEDTEQQSKERTYEEGNASMEKTTRVIEIQIV